MAGLSISEAETESSFHWSAEETKVPKASKERDVKHQQDANANLKMLSGELTSDRIPRMHEGAVVQYLSQVSLTKKPAESATPPFQNIVNSG